MRSNSYYPKFQVEGFNNDGFSQVVDLYFPQPVISTNVHPIFDARLARSNSPKDVPLINPIRKLLNIWGFDCSTLGIEVQAQKTAGIDFIQSEKEWASQGGCFVGILTERDISQQTGEGLPPAWTYVESGMAFSEKKPMFAFLEKGVRSEAIFNYCDNVHRREFSISDLGNSLVGIDNDLIRLRNDIEKYRVGRSIDNILDVSTKALAVIGGITIITGLIDSFSEV